METNYWETQHKENGETKLLCFLWFVLQNESIRKKSILLINIKDKQEKQNSF